MVCKKLNLTLLFQNLRRGLSANIKMRKDAILAKARLANGGTDSVMKKEEKESAEPFLP